MLALGKEEVHVIRVRWLSMVISDRWAGKGPGAHWSAAPAPAVSAMLPGLPQAPGRWGTIAIGSRRRRRLRP